MNLNHFSIEHIIAFYRRTWYSGRMQIKPYLAQVECIPDAFSFKYLFKNGDTVVVLGEIEQMPGHVVIALKNGQVLSGYHTEWFRKLRKDEA